MTGFPLAPHQSDLVERPLTERIFLEGPAGTGKTSAGVARLLRLLEEGVPARFILVIVPQRTLAGPYHRALQQPTVRAGGQVTVSTIGGLARRMVDLFWPLVAEEADFAHPDRLPLFLTLETAQYYMARLAAPMLDAGHFESVTIERNRLYSQILDNLNKAAIIGFPHDEIAERLKAAWGGEESQRRVYDEAQSCATQFRDYCLAHNLLDFSLQVELFVQHVWTLPLCRDLILKTYQHLIVDNVEEDTPVAHDLLREWIPHCTSALLIQDQDGGYRRFLGADPESGGELQELCDERMSFSDSFVTSPGLQLFARHMAFKQQDRKDIPVKGVRDALVYDYHRYYPQVLDWVADQIADLVHEANVPPAEIVVLAPFMPDALRFSLRERLERRDVPTRSHRPSRALREENATRCLLTLAALAHPTWKICPPRFELVYALVQAIEDLDLVRAQLLAEIVYRSPDGVPTLNTFDLINVEMQERLTYRLGERYEALRLWLEHYTENKPEELDHFLSRLFGELLSQPGFGFHRDHDAGQVTANLIESIRKFRRVVREEDGEDKSLGQDYIEMVQDGVVAAQYVGSWQVQAQEAVLLAPAYTFLMSNRPVDYQFWLDVGGRGWWERLYQPLTHPYVLSRGWPGDRIWTDADEVAARNDALFRLNMGLIRRCRTKIYLGLSELDAGGREAKGNSCRQSSGSCGISPLHDRRGRPMIRPRPKQQEVLDYAGGKMGVSAVPGSGKTYTLSLWRRRSWPAGSWRRTKRSWS